MPSPQIDEDAIDDVLYFARTGETKELQAILEQISKDTRAPPHDILAAAKDGETGNTALHMAAANGHTETLKLLLSFASIPLNQVTLTTNSGQEVLDIKNNSGNTALHWASLNGHLEAVKMLVAAGADLLVKNNAGHDVVYEAEVAGNEDVVNWLLSAGKEDEEEAGEVSGKEDVNREKDEGNHVNGVTEDVKNVSIQDDEKT